MIRKTKFLLTDILVVKEILLGYKGHKHPFHSTKHTALKNHEFQHYGNKPALEPLKFSKKQKQV